MYHIIDSLLSTDMYKLSMQQAVLHNFPKTNVKVEFKCRSNVKLGYLKPALDKELDHLCSLRFTKDELNYLRSIYYLSSDYVDYLKMFQLDREHIKTGVDEDGQLTIIAEGPWREVIGFEIPCLAIVQELYMQDKQVNLEYADSAITDKIIKFKQANMKYPFKLSDFGLRRRYSSTWHEHVVTRFAKECPEFFVGTSNVKLAQKLGIKPIGTFAHEWFGGIQGESVRVSDVQRVALDTWAKEYRGELGIALSDNFGFRAFLRDFDKYFAKLFDGCRHDSGCPFKWGEMLIEHYKKLGIDPLTKTACWSDALDPDKAIALAKQFSGRINVTFGIGTNLTNDVGFKPVSIVMKVVESNGKPVCKISDSPGKGMCHDEQYVEYVKTQYNYKSIDEE